MKKILLTVLATLCIMPALAQTDAGLTTVKQQNRHEIWLGGGGGISSLRYAPSVGSHKTGFGYNGGISYTYWLNYRWGVSVGGEYQLLKSEYSLDPKSIDGALDRYLVPFPGSEDIFVYQATPLSKIRERQEAVYINIPVTARYQIDITGKNSPKRHRLVLSAGLKVGIPFEGSYRTGGVFETSGLDLDLEPRDGYIDMPNHGFGTWTLDDSKISWKQKLNFSGTLEAGVRWQFSPRWGLYTGLFADLGFVDVAGNSDQTGYLQYNPQGRPPEIGTILTSNYGRVDGVNGGTDYRTSFADPVRTIAAGIKIAATFGFSPFDKKHKALLPVSEEDPWDKPVTGNQMRSLLKEQTDELTDAQREEFEKLLQFLREESKQPDLSAPIYCFDFDRDNIPADMKSVLDHKAELLKKHPLVSLTVEGHTDAAGSERYNYSLGLRRAEAVKYYLVSRGVAGSRLSVTSKGKKDPIVNAPAGDRKAGCPNRRVEFILRK